MPHRGHKAFECEAEPSIPEGGLPYQFLHLNVLREHLELEYGRIIGGLEWFDLERVIDDFILMCFLVGNDFLPRIMRCLYETLKIPSIGIWRQ